MGSAGPLTPGTTSNHCLSSRHPFYALDLPGFGLSAHPRDFGYTLKEQAEAIAAFLQFVLERNPGSKITLMGHSFEGSIAIATAVLLLDNGTPLVDSLLLIDALGFPQSVHLPLYLNFLRMPVMNRLVLHHHPDHGGDLACSRQDNHLDGTGRRGGVAASRRERCLLAF
jgi:pimeloyl-ACP methyl ester carboxylesterase